MPEENSKQTKTKRLRKLVQKKPNVFLVVIYVLVLVAVLGGIYPVVSKFFKLGSRSSDNVSTNSGTETLVSDLIDENGSMGVDEKGNPLPKEAEILSPQSIVRCNEGPYPEVSGVAKLSEERDWAFGVVTSKKNNEKMTVSVEQTADKTVRDVDLYDVDVIEFRMIKDKDGYLGGKVDSFEHVQFNNGDPYGIDEYYTYLPLGSHIWVPEDDVSGKYLQIYCYLQ